MTGRSGWCVTRVYFCFFLITHDCLQYLLSVRQHRRASAATTTERHHVAEETSARRHHCCMSAASTTEGPCAVRGGSNCRRAPAATSTESRRATAETKQRQHRHTPEATTTDCHCAATGGINDSIPHASLRVSNGSLHPKQQSIL